MRENLQEKQKTGYFKHGSIFAPDNLQVGDIIECKIASQMGDPSGATRYLDRKAVILGFQTDTKQASYTGVHVAKLASTQRAILKENSFRIDKEMGESGDISGVSFFPCVLRTSHTDVLPLDETHFPSGKIVRIGHVSPALLTRFSDALRETKAQGLSTPSTYGEIDSEQIYIPSFRHVLGIAPETEIVWPEIGRPYSQPDDYDKARIASEMQNDDRIVSSDLDIDEVIDDLRKQKEEQSLLWKKWWQASLPAVKTFNKMSIAPQARNISEANLPRFQDFKEVRPKPRKDKIKKEPTARPPVIRSTSSEAVITPTKRRTYVVADQQQQTTFSALIEHFKTGAGVSRIALPEMLWQGRYIHLKISDLMNDQDNRPAYRPCSIWKVFKDKDTGELAGMELHPAIREKKEVDRFSYQMPISPQYTQSRKPSYLVADCVIRVPLDPRYFHETFAGNFFELPKDKVEEFAELREIVILSEAPVHVYGLQEIPDNWVEKKLLDMPSYEQFKKWAEPQEIRFQGAPNIQKKMSGYRERQP